MDKKKGKELALILRHNPGLVEGELDSSGWLDIGKLLKHGWTYTKLKEIVETDDKGRYEMTETKIRALQGHSIKGINPGYQPYTGKWPLYHGTKTTRLESIYRLGIVSGHREYVHLSDNLEQAKKIGSRHIGGQVVVLEISEVPGALISKNGVILVKNKVETKYIQREIYVDRS